MEKEQKNYKTQFRIKKIQLLTAGKNGRKMRLLVKISICLKAQKKQQETFKYIFVKMAAGP